MAVERVEALATRDERSRALVRELLGRAIDGGYVDVVVVGICADGSFEVDATPSYDKLRVIGALTVATRDAVASTLT